MTFIVQSYFDTLLHYMLSVTFGGAVVSVKVMDQNFNDTGEIRNLVFFLGFFEDSRSLLQSSIDS